MRRRDFIKVIIGSATAWPLAARAQQRERKRNIGVLLSFAQSDPEVNEDIAAFKHALQELGWTEGTNVRFAMRFAAADPERMQSNAAELVSLAPDVILTSSNMLTSIIGQQTHTIPIVFASAGDVLETGLITNLARPGGNITGFTTYEISMGGKLLELLKEAAPQLSRVAVIYQPGGPAPLEVLRIVETAAPSLGMKISSIPGSDPAEIERRVKVFADAADSGLLVTFGPATVRNRKQIITLAAQYRLPAIYPARYFVAEGGLMSYGASLLDQYRHAATYVDRILRGAKPSDLPVQAPTKYDLVINAKTAKMIGLDVPPSMLARADEVIE
jgi:putative tryptophan/tyrosine transport system substrate-binding protein